MFLENGRILEKFDYFQNKVGPEIAILKQILLNFKSGVILAKKDDFRLTLIPVTILENVRIQKKFDHFQENPKIAIVIEVLLNFKSGLFWRKMA